MRKVLDLGELLKHLRQTEEHEPHFDEVLNPYLLHTVLPQLESEEPIRLEQIDFDQLLLLEGRPLQEYAPYQQADF